MGELCDCLPRGADVESAGIGLQIVVDKCSRIPGHRGAKLFDVDCEKRAGRYGAVPKALPQSDTQLPIPILESLGAVKPFFNGVQDQLAGNFIKTRACRTKHINFGRI
jgi:hypothetical protein